MKKVLITGVTGFAGSHLAKFLQRDNNLIIFGTYLSEVWGIDKKFNFRLDLTNKEEVDRLIREIKPDFVFHLAALTAPGKSFSEPYETISNNIKSQLYLLEALRVYQPTAKILIVGSGDEYGLVKKEENPIDENQPLRPTSPYAVSKIAQDFLGLQYALSFKMKIVRVRPFNHIGPGQSPSFVVSAIAKQIAEIEKTDKEPILKIGNVSSIRDFTDVSDMVKAYWLVINKGEIGEVYNIGSGTGFTIEKILKILLSHSSKKIRIQVDKGLVRQSDNPILVCNAEKFRKISGWSPVVKIEDSLMNILEYWRKFKGG